MTKSVKSSFSVIAKEYTRNGAAEREAVPKLSVVPCLTSDCFASADATY
jgi:hypothetical protein